MTYDLKREQPPADGDKTYRVEHDCGQLGVSQDVPLALIESWSAVDKSHGYSRVVARYALREDACLAARLLIVQGVRQLSLEAMEAVMKVSDGKKASLVRGSLVTGTAATGKADKRAVLVSKRVAEKRLIVEVAEGYTPSLVAHLMRGDWAALSADKKTICLKHGVVVDHLNCQRPELSKLGVDRTAKDFGLVDLTRPIAAVVGSSTWSGGEQWECGMLPAEWPHQDIGAYRRAVGMSTPHAFPPAVPLVPVQFDESILNTPVIYGQCQQILKPREGHCAMLDDSTSGGEMLVPTTLESSRLTGMVVASTEEHERIVTAPKVEVSACREDVVRVGKVNGRPMHFEGQWYGPGSLLWIVHEEMESKCVGKLAVCESGWNVPGEEPQYESW